VSFLVFTLLYTPCVAAIAIDWSALALIALGVFFAVRSIRRQHKNGGCCGCSGCSCSSCGGCGKK
jgi:hypothetical protein